MEIVPLGDNALLIRLPCDLEKAPEQTLEVVLDASRRLQTAKIPGVVELVPAYTTIALFYDPVRVVDGGAPIDDIVGWLGAKIESTLRGSSKRKARKSNSRLVEIPVCYDKEFGFDLEEVAQRAKLSVGETIQMHTAGTYRVHCVGFTPGFAFLGGLDGSWRRRDAPRRALEFRLDRLRSAGKQTGVYPIRSPGGWNVIGRTPLRMFDVRREPPALLCAGDRVRFRNITREEFENLKA